MQNRKIKKIDPQKEKVFIPKMRYWIIVFILVFGMAVLFARIAYLKFVENETLSKAIDQRSIRSVARPVFKAMIKDRHGKLLAVSVKMYNVYVNPKQIQEKHELEKKEETWKQLAHLLNLNYSDLESKINRKGSGFVYLKKEITFEKMQQIEALKLSSVHFESTAHRYYPQGESMAQLIGLTQQDNGSDGVGISGIEKRFDAELTGQSGAVIHRKSLSGKPTEELAAIDGEKGTEIMLSIDARLQNLIYNNLMYAIEINQAESATAVLIDIKTSEILALVSAPSYNPNNRKTIKSGMTRNRAIEDAFEPGSTVKPFIVALALEKNIATTKTLIDTRPIVLNKYPVKDVSYQAEANLEQILVKSSNVGVSKLALKMNPKQVVDFYHSFGLGEPTNLGLIGEQKGNINADRARWSDIERATYAYGYGLSVTPLQLARAYAALGRGGVYCPVTLIKNDVSKVLSECQRVLPEKIDRQILTYLNAVAEHNSHISVPGYQIGIKTGTAKKIGKGKQYENRYVAYTAGIAPIVSPRYALVVLIDDPRGKQYYGGAISAPVFSKIMGSVLRANNIEPDKKQ